MSAFESITTRQSWYAASAVAKYMAVEYDATGKLKLADGTGVFAGICEYPADAAEEMITVVKGTFPGVCTEDISAGDKLTIAGTGDNAGRFKVALATSVVYGVALTDAKSGELTTVAMVEAPVPASE